MKSKNKGAKLDNGGSNEDLINISSNIHGDNEHGNNDMEVKENLVDDSIENLGHECIEVLIVDNDLSVVKVHEKLLDRFQLKTRHVANGSELNEVLQELIDCK